MKRFLLSLAAAALFQSLVCAQSVFSVNVVGYVDLQLHPGSNLVANPLNAASNTLAYLFPRLPDGSSFLSWNAQVQAFDSTNRYSAVTGWSNPDQVFVQPEAGFLVVSQSLKISFHGEPWRFAAGPNCITYPQNMSFIGWIPTDHCGFCDPGPCPEFFSDGAVVSTWDPVFQVYLDYMFFSGFGWVPSPPVLTAAQGARLVDSHAISGRGLFAGGSSFLQHGRRFHSIRDVQRSGTNLAFRVEGAGAGGYSVLSTTNLGSGLWRVVATGSNPPVTIHARADGIIEFYKVHPPYGPFPMLISRSRVGTSFSFDFYAPTNGTYEVQRSPVFPGNSFATISTVTAQANTVVTVVDDTAACAAGYYRVARLEAAPGQRSGGRP